MAENTFKSPGFFEREIEITAEKQQPTGVPAGIIGAAQMGPAFVPLTLGTFTDFENRFGSLDPKKFAPYAVREWLKNRQSVTFIRVLGAGSNLTGTDFQNTRDYGHVKNAGFKATANGGSVSLHTNQGSGIKGATQFLVAKHVITAESDFGFPIFTDNNTFGSQGLNTVDVFNPLEHPSAAATSSSDAALRESTASAADDEILICRAMILNTSGSFFQLKAHTTNQWNANTGEVTFDNGSNKFEMLLVNFQDSSAPYDISWGYDEPIMDNGNTYKVPNRKFTVSLDPDNTKYIGKVLNTDPAKFSEEGHLLYLDFAIENDLAPVSLTSAANSPSMNPTENNVYLSTGATAANGTSAYHVANSTEYWMDTFGRFDMRYRAPRTTAFISQPYGSIEYDLFHFECLSDGVVANNEFKISVQNLKRSLDPKYPYGTFDVLVRKFSDNDFQPEVLERFVGCNLDPDSEFFVGRKIGDKKAVFNFDADLSEERRLVISGRYPNKSLNIRIVINDAVYKREIPKDSLPFGFRGIPVLDVLNKLQHSDAKLGQLPPMPFVFKATKGPISTAPTALLGEPGTNERADSRVYWGVKTTRIESRSIVSDPVYQSNISSRPNRLVRAYTKVQGLMGGTVDIGNLKFGSACDSFNNNKFTLARVALKHANLTAFDSAGLSVSEEIKNACYIRNKDPQMAADADYHVIDTLKSGSTTKRITLATLFHRNKDGKPSDANDFNKFADYLKFTNVFYGGWDGVNMLDPDIPQLNDNASSSSGKAADNLTGGTGLIGSQNGTMSGKGKDQNIVSSYRKAVDIMTDPMTVRTNLLAIPGIRDPYITDHAATKIREYSMGMYVMDIEPMDGDGDRIFGTSARPAVENTSNQFSGRAIDNNYCASYFPDVYISDPINNRRVLVPASVAALGALGYSDSVSYPWFAPAGFNRGALDFVENAQTRLSVADRDELYDKRINPIANFPDGGFVIFGQKTMQQTQSALDRVNVRRLLLEVKRQVSQVANSILFEQNTPETRARFVNLVQPRLALIQAQAGLEKFRVICDDTNNTPADAEENKLNGKIVLIPTRTIEFIAIDFIITSAGVSFE